MCVCVCVWFSYYMKFKKKHLQFQFPKYVFTRMIVVVMIDDCYVEIVHHVSLMRR